MQRIVAPNLDAASDKNQHGIGIVGRLHIRGLDLVRQLANGLVLLDNGVGALHLLTFKCQHGTGILQ